MTASVVLSTLSVNTHHTAMAFASRKWPAVLHDDEVRDCLVANLKKVYQIRSVTVKMQWMTVPLLMLWMVTVIKMILFKTLCDRTWTITREKKWSVAIHNSVTWRTTCEVCQCARTQSDRLTFFWQHSATSDRKTFYKQDFAFWEENKTAKTVYCLSKVRRGRGKETVLAWHRTLCGMFSRLLHQAQFLR
jgi:hypothetical protein